MIITYILLGLLIVIDGVSIMLNNMTNKEIIKRLDDLKGHQQENFKKKFYNNKNNKNTNKQ